MTSGGLKQLSLYLEDHGCAALTTARALRIFTDVSRQHLANGDHPHLKTFQPELSPLL